MLLSVLTLLTFYLKLVFVHWRGLPSVIYWSMLRPSFLKIVCLNFWRNASHTCCRPQSSLWANELICCSETPLRVSERPQEAPRLLYNIFFKILTQIHGTRVWVWVQKDTFCTPTFILPHHDLFYLSFLVRYELHSKSCPLWVGQTRQTDRPDRQGDSLTGRRADTHAHAHTHTHKCTHSVVLTHTHTHTYTGNSRQWYNSGVCLAVKFDVQQYLRLLCIT